jgi:hypothetical protein
VAYFEKCRIEKFNTHRAVGTLENTNLILKPRIEFWAITGRAVGSSPKVRKCCFERTQINLALMAHPV